MVWNSLVTRARTLFYVQALTRVFLVWMPMTLAAMVPLSSFLSWSTLRWGLGGWALVLMFITLWFPWLNHERWAWALRDGDIVLSRGVIVHRITAIPLRRIQHVDVRQGPVERALGLASIAIYTGSGQGADGVLPGLPLAEAEKLRDRMVKVSGDDGV
jgi:membrane protein YdbS with pleckstrin-like domain